MKTSFFRFNKKSNYLEVINGLEYDIKTSVVFPVIYEETGNTLKNEDGLESKELKALGYFFVNVLGDYPVELEPFKVEIESPAVNWA